MALIDWIPWRRKPATASEILQLGAEQGYPPGVRPVQQGVSAAEFGVSGTENFGGYIRKEDFNPELDDWEKAVAIYDKMRRTDAQVRAMLQVINRPLRTASW